ncbi:MULTISPECIES: hypothetical protein [unclassified Duganella]|uniref:hypothetical protein n=1 Tax=unclassified Duganella TaxID=2636909 RepID=UPI000E354A87|nr:MULTISPECIES: hypothetical protein [unclassified Duganella]RFP11884.1 hypothetical protein D0T23_18085 [Duganella sp. BJB475]RFP31450.1 hypothetical protein D0T21_16405 [Duganella sp. BJB476]
MTVVRIFATIALLGAAAVAQGGEAAATLHALNDAELRGVSTPIPAPVPRLPARSLSRGLFPLHGLFGGGGDSKAAGMGTQLFPLLGLLNADVTARDVAYGTDGAALRMNADGSVNLALPATIGELDLQNIRTGVNDNSNFGSVQIKGIDLSRTVISVTPTR